MTPEFKVGDRVRIKKTSTSLPTPSERLGRTATVTQVRNWGPFEYRVRPDGGESSEDNWLCKRDELERPENGK